MKSYFLTPSSYKNFDQLFRTFDNHWVHPASLFGTESENNTVEFSSEFKFITDKSLWQLTAELAGVQKDSLKLDAKEDHLHISGEKTKGLSTGHFEKIYRLPQGCDAEKIEAEFNDGVLILTIPLLEKKTVKSIQFKS